MLACHAVSEQQAERFSKTAGQYPRGVYHTSLFCARGPGGGGGARAPAYVVQVHRRVVPQAALVGTAAVVVLHAVRVVGLDLAAAATARGVQISGRTRRNWQAPERAGCLSWNTRTCWHTTCFNPSAHLRALSTGTKQAA